MFINSKNLEHYAWTVALTRMISAIFRRGGDVAFVVEELKAVFDPQGGQWMGGRYVPSLLAAIGQVIETHMIRTGFLVAGAGPGSEAPRTARQPRRPLAARRARPRQALSALQLAVPVSPGRLLGVQLLRLFEVRLKPSRRRRALTRSRETCRMACSALKSLTCSHISARNRRY